MSGLTLSGGLLATGVPLASPGASLSVEVSDAFSVAETTAATLYALLSVEVSDVFSVAESLEAILVASGSLIDTPVSDVISMTDEIQAALVEGPYLLADFARPRSLAFDGTSLWTSSVGAHPGQGQMVSGVGSESHIIQKVDPNRTRPAVIAAVDMSAYSNGGEGIDGLNPAPVYVGIRHVEVDGGYVFACVQSLSNLNTTEVYGFCVIIDVITNLIVGHVRFQGVNSNNRSADVTAVTFDGAGNFFVAVGAPSNVASSDLHKFSVASVLSAYPSYGTPVLSVTTAASTHIEEMTYGAGYLWAVHGAVTGSTAYRLTRIDPTTLTIVDYVLENALIVDIMATVLFAFGSVWTIGVGSGVTATHLLRFNPATFPSAPTVLPNFTPATSGDFDPGTAGYNGMTLESDGTYLWACTSGSAHRIHRFSTGLGTEALVSTIVSPETTDHFPALTFDGTDMWAVSRDGAQPGLVRISTGVGTEAFTYSLLNNGPAPIVFGIAPSTISSAGGDYVVIEVDNSTGADSTSVGGLNLTSFVVLDPTHVAGFTQDHAAGIVDVIVARPGAITSAPLVGGATYQDPAVWPASFSAPRSLAFDGSSLWVSAVSSFQPEAHIIQKIDPQLALPAVVKRVDVSAYSNGGEGADGLNPAPVQVAVRQVRANGGYVFACVLAGKNLNTNEVYGFCVIIDATTNVIAGHVRFLAPSTTTRDSDAAAVTFDGAGNFYVAENRTFTAGPGYIHKFSVAAVLAAYPGYGTPVYSALVPSAYGAGLGHIEDMAFGAGYIWAVHGTWDWAGTSVSALTRIDPTDGSHAYYTLVAPNADYLMMSVKFAFGSVWAVSVKNGGYQANLLRFDPATFPSVPTVLPNLSTSGPSFQGATVGYDTSTVWLSTYWTDATIYRYSTGLGSEALVSTIVSPEATDHFMDLVYDGTDMWTPTRNGLQPGIVRISTGIGTEAFTFSLLNGDPVP